MSLGKYAAWAMAVVAVVVILVLVVIRLTSVRRNVAYVSEEEGGVAVIDLNTLEVVKMVQPKDVAPRGIGLTFDGKYLVVADKDTADATVFATGSLKVVQKFHVGDNPEFVKIAPDGKSMFISYEPGSSGGPPSATGDDDDANEPPAEILQVRVDDWSPVRSFVAGKETEGLEFSADGRSLIVANEAQDTLGVYDVDNGTRTKEVNLATYGKRPRGVKVSPDGDTYAVTMEGSGTLLTLDKSFNVIHTTSTAAKPYGVAFDRQGKRIFVAAAAARKLQVYASSSLQLLGETPIGQRCWHFTFTPDDSKVLMACGRSNSVYVVDANTYQQIKVIGGFQLPWGIITNPRAYGTLGLP